MLITISTPGELDGERLMEIYREGNEENAEEQYPDMDRSEALETHPDYRRRGFGEKILSETLKTLEKTGKFEVHDCVSKKNEASLATHRKCGFVIDSGVGVDYLSGERKETAYGMGYYSK